MRVFVTGASGHIGSPLVSELLKAGYEVVGLARSERSAAALTALGANVHRSDLDDLGGLRETATAVDGVVHLGFKHDLNDPAAASRSDLSAVQAMGAALEGTNKPFVVTSTTLQVGVAGPGLLATEEVSIKGGPRIDSENTTIATAGRGVRSSVVRLPPLVHSSLDHHGFTALLIETARATGVSAYVGDGTNRWPAVHTLDAAHLFRLALDAAPAGTRLHGVDDQGVTFRNIAWGIGRHLNVPVVSIAPDNADKHFGCLGPLVALDIPASSEQTRKLLDWQPTQLGLLADLDQGHYFESRRGLSSSPGLHTRLDRTLPKGERE